MKFLICTSIFLACFISVFGGLAVNHHQNGVSPKVTLEQLATQFLKTIDDCEIAVHVCASNLTTLAETVNATDVIAEVAMMEEEVITESRLILEDALSAIGSGTDIEDLAILAYQAAVKLDNLAQGARNGTLTLFEQHVPSLVPEATAILDQLAVSVKNAIQPLLDLLQQVNPDP